MNPEKKIAGVLTPLFALRREKDLGIGDTGALMEFVEWAANHGFRLVQILPINETGADNSPYNAISSTALDPVTLKTDPQSLKDLSAEEYASILNNYDLENLRKGDVDYANVKRLKRALLWSAFQVFETKLPKGGGRAKKFHKFCKKHAAWLQGYTLFRALMDRHGNELWDQWPQEQQTAQQASAWLDLLCLEERQQLEQSRLFYAYVQWVAFEQWVEVREFCEKREVVLMGDVPIGVSYYSADVFSHRAIFDLTWSGGAPPERVFTADPFTEKWGQNWGVPHYRWDTLKERDYDWWRQRVRVVREVFHLFRIDHVLGFYRIYSFPWRPQQNAEFLPLSPEEAAARAGGRLPQFLPNDDDTPEHRDANRRGGEVLLGMLLEEVGKYRLIGEDLGVVPEYVRPSLSSLGIAGFKVPMWETAWDGRLLPGGGYNRLSLATYATHDHDPLRVYWENASYEIREKLAVFAGIQNATPSYTDEIHEALLLALLKSNSWIAVVMITDLFGTTERFNVPGAVATSNWSRRLEKNINEWQSLSRIRDLIKQGNR